jgi:hypothetical protein
MKPIVVVVPCATKSVENFPQICVIFPLPDLFVNEPASLPSRIRSTVRVGRFYGLFLRGIAQYESKIA